MDWTLACLSMTNKHNERIEMKIAITAPEHPNTPLHGGIARYLRDYVPALAKKHEVLLISVEDGPLIEGVKQVILPKSPLPSPLTPPWLSKKINTILHDYSPDVVEYANWMGLGCKDNGSWKKLVRISTPVKYGSLRNGILPKLALPLHHHWEKKSIQNMDYCISNTNANIETCQNAYGSLPETTVIPHGINLPIAAPLDTACDILFVGRFEERKGVDVLLKAWKLLISENKIAPQIKLRLVGRETYPCPEGYLRNLLGKFEINSDRIVIHDNPGDDELNEIKQLCIVNVIPSRYESFGMVALEAHAANLAVVASDVGGLKEVVEDKVNGLLFTVGDPDQLADKLASLLNEPDSRSKYIEKGINLLNTRFSIKSMVDESLKVYEKVIANVG